LSDGFGTVDSIARDVFNAEDIRDYSVKPNFAEKLAKQFGADMAEGVASALSRVSVR
jgi:protease-4